MQRGKKMTEQNSFCDWENYFFCFREGAQQETDVSELEMWDVLRLWKENNVQREFFQQEKYLYFFLFMSHVPFLDSRWICGHTHLQIQRQMSSCSPCTC